MTLHDISTSGFKDGGTLLYSGYDKTNFRQEANSDIDGFLFTPGKNVNGNTLKLFGLDV